MKSALMYVLLVWLTTIVISPPIYYFVFGAERIDAPMVFYIILFGLLFSIPAAGIMIFVAAFINKELQNPPLKKMIIGLCSALLIIIAFWLLSGNNIRSVGDYLSIYCGVAILSSLVYKLKPQ